jgi:GH15 family glucan-1,4-alpha-glucosidase
LSYLPIEDHGVIGDLHTAALVGIDGTIDWLCMPFFDSPSLFASILDDKKGGHFRIAATSPDARRRQMYLPDSNVLMTRFMTPDGVGEVVDFMPIHMAPGRKKAEDHQVIRIVRGVRGTLPFRMECFPSFDYGRRRIPPHRKSGSGFRFAGSGHAVDLLTTLDCEVRDEGVAADFEVKEGDEIPVLLSQAGDGDPPPSDQLQRRCQNEFKRSLAYWQNWAARTRYQGRWREMVTRSALALKLLTFSPTGAIVAAATTSLPERVGGERNWDYRYTWIRDSAFTVYAFLRIGLTEEAEQFMRFLENIARDLEPGAGLNVLYGIDGRTEVPEICLDHLEGYRGSRPVRIGNAAAKQFQLDIGGELMDAIYLCNKYAQPISSEFWETARRLADWVSEHWQKPDEGIWEVRGGAHEFTFSKLMCWVALDRAARIAEDRSLPSPRPHWIETRDTIYETIMKRGFSTKLNSFVQSLDSEILDAAVLLAPMVKFISPSDPRMLGTLQAIKERLESDQLVLRYDPSVSPDGLEGHEGFFSMCTFWLAEALARSGNLSAARLTFEKMLGYANHLGLYAEQIGHTGEALGNFPQAFTHLGLISAAVNISRLLDEARGPRKG